jgi:hypothetical protein
MKKPAPIVFADSKRYFLADMDGRLTTTSNSVCYWRTWAMAGFGARL